MLDELLKSEPKVSRNFVKAANLDETIKKTDYDFPWKAEADFYQQDDRKTMQGGVAKINYEEPQLRKDGSKNWLRTSKIPLMNHEERTIGVPGMYEDITERKQLAQKLEQIQRYRSADQYQHRHCIS